jgi:glutaredoxin
MPTMPPLRLLLIVLLLAMAPPRMLLAAEAADVSVFWRVGCPHCEREIEFLRALQARDPSVRVRLLEVSADAANRQSLRQTAVRLHIEEIAVPFTVIGEEAVVGFWDDPTTGAQIEQLIASCRARGCPDVVGELMRSRSEPAASVATAPRAALPRSIRVPLLGEIDTAGLSLPALTLVLGAVDGFNPCAMWTLVFLIGMLIGMRDRTRMWVLGGTFLVASAAVYFVFMAAWLNLLLFLGALLWIRLAVGAVALAGGAWYLREFWVNREGACEVTSQERRRRTLQRLRALAMERSFLLAMGGIVLLAFAVNLIEMLCSAGIPAVYTQVLAMSNLPAWHYYAYMLLYILVFLFDDLVVFFTAMITLQVSGLTATYSRWSHLIGGVVLVAIGALMWVRPQWLMFG